MHAKMNTKEILDETLFAKLFPIAALIGAHQHLYRSLVALLTTEEY